MNPTVLGIETSCDETSASVVRGGKVLSNVVSSQIELHRRFNGVVPELASRDHLLKISEVVVEAVDKAFPGRNLTHLGDLVDAVAFTRGPGLTGALLIGKIAAQAMAWSHGLPLLGVNHLEGHALAYEFEKTVEFPLIALVVSGGHTDLVLIKGHGRYKVLGRTRDDAAGEAYDKVATLLKLGYPGGPVIDKLAKQGDPRAIAFPRPLLPGTWDFSFSGLKTSVMYYVRDHAKVDVADVCASFQEAVVDTLTEKALLAAQKHRAPRVVVGGGVAANSRLREKLAQEGAKRGVSVLFTPFALCTDNAAMIAHVGALQFEKRGVPHRRLAVDPNLPFRDW